MTSASASPNPPANDSASHCDQCQGPLSRGGICARCSLQLGRYAGGDLSGVLTPTHSHHHSSRSSTKPAISVDELAAHFPQYEVLDLIGQGGMGAVYRARQKSLDRMVALKIIMEAEDDPAFAERFTREARTLARLSHPHIVTIHDFGHIGTMYFFVMEYVDGVNLRQAINAQAFDPSDALRVVSQVCEALQYAHAQGVVHRDIKPENILLTETGHVKIADFGLAKMLGEHAEDVTLTGTRQVVGTPAYMAPEQIDHSTAIDHRADIYSLGVVFYELLTGQLPLGRFEPPSHRLGKLDQRIDPVVMKTLSREPAERYQQAHELQGEVEHLSSSAIPTPTPAPAPTPYDAATAYHTGGTDSAEVLPTAELYQGPFPPQKTAAWEAPAFQTAAGPTPHTGSHHNTPKQSPTNAPPVARVAFHCDDHGGLSKARGLLHFEPNQLRVEWRTRPLDMFDGAANTITIPWSDISQLHLHKSILRRRLKVTGVSLHSLGSLPTGKTGTAVLSIARADVPAIRPWLAWFSQPTPLWSPTAPTATRVHTHAETPSWAHNPTRSCGWFPGRSGARDFFYFAGVAMLILFLLAGKRLINDTNWITIGTKASSNTSSWTGTWATVSVKSGDSESSRQIELDAAELPLVEMTWEDGKRYAIFQLTSEARIRLSDRIADTSSLPDLITLPESLEVEFDDAEPLQLRRDPTTNSQDAADAPNPAGDRLNNKYRSPALTTSQWRHFQQLATHYRTELAHPVPARPQPQPQPLTPQ